MRNTGLFVGETVGGKSCFQPERKVSRGEFLAMVVKLLDVPMEEGKTANVPADTPQWLRPYLAAALRAGLTAGAPQEDLEAPITGAEAAVLLQNALDLSVDETALETINTDETPEWARVSLAVMAQNGLTMEAETALTRAQVAEILYRVNDLAATAPGTAVFRMQE